MRWKNEKLYIDRLLNIGIIPARKDADQRRQLDEVLQVACPLLFPYVTAGRLVFIFPYKLDDQTPQYCRMDGLCLSPECKAGPHAVGISDHALHRGRDYATSVLFHELAHIEHDGHDFEFVDCLNSLIDHYNRATGRAIKDETDYARAEPARSIQSLSPLISERESRM
jgi:hypothetical protein